MAAPRSECCICRETFRDPFSLECGDVYCTACIRSHVTAGWRRCPLCQYWIGETFLTHLLQETIDASDPASDDSPASPPYRPASPPYRPPPAVDVHDCHPVSSVYHLPPSTAVFHQSYSPPIYRSPAGFEDAPVYRPPFTAVFHQGPPLYRSPAGFEDASVYRPPPAVFHQGPVSPIYPPPAPAVFHQGPVYPPPAPVFEAHPPAPWLYKLSDPRRRLHGPSPVSTTHPASPPSRERDPKKHRSLSHHPSPPTLHRPPSRERGRPDDTLEISLVSSSSIHGGLLPKRLILTVNGQRMEFVPAAERI